VFSAVETTSYGRPASPPSVIVSQRFIDLPLEQETLPQLVARIEKEKILEALERHEYVQTARLKTWGFTSGIAL